MDGWDAQEVRNALLTWGAAVGGLGAIPASPGPGSGGRSWGERTGPTHPAATPTPPHPAPPPPLNHISSGDGGEDRGTSPGLPLPIPEMKGSAASQTPPPATPSPLRRAVGEARLTPAKPRRGAAQTRALGITASGGLRISRPPAHPEPRAAPPAPAAGSVISNSDLLRGCLKGPQPHRSRTMAAAAGQRRKCACARGASLPQPRGLAGRANYASQRPARARAPPRRPQKTH